MVKKTRMGGKRLPFIQFSPADWRNHQGLQLCSYEAQGVWMHILCLMHDGQPYGTLYIKESQTDHEAVTKRLQNVRKLLKLSPKKFAILMAELSENGVFSTDENGMLYSRRMVRDNALRLKNSANGKLGGNPQLVNPPLKSGDKPRIKKEEERIESVEAPTVFSGDMGEDAEALIADINKALGMELGATQAQDVVKIVSRPDIGTKEYDSARAELVRQIADKEITADFLDGKFQKIVVAQNKVGESKPKMTDEQQRRAHLFVGEMTWETAKNSYSYTKEFWQEARDFCNKEKLDGNK